MFAAAKYGGGLAFGNGGENQCHRCVVEGNRAQSKGGGVYLDADALLRLLSSAVTNNTTLLNGGAVFVSRAAVLRARASNITDNSASSDGGGVSVDDAAVAFSDCRLERNSASRRNAGALHLSAGGSANVTDCHFLSNVAAQKGGALYAQSSSWANLRGVVASANSARYGGAVAAADEAWLRCAACSFRGNRAEVHGGAIFAEDQSRVALAGAVLFHSNVAQSLGGGVYTTFLRQDSLNTTAATTVSFRRNQALHGGGVYWHFVVGANPSRVFTCAQCVELDWNHGFMVGTNAAKIRVGWVPPGPCESGKYIRPTTCGNASSGVAAVTLMPFTTFFIMLRCA